MNKNITQYNELVNKRNNKIVSHEAVQVILPIQKRHFKKGEFITMRKDFLYDVIYDYNLKFLDLKVLSYFIKNIDFNNRIKTFNQTTVASDIQSTQQNVSKSIKNLIEKNIIYKHKLDYYFSDEFIKFAGDK